VCYNIKQNFLKQFFKIKNKYMKKASLIQRFLLGTMLFSSVTTLTSCDKDDDTPPAPVVNNLVKVLTDSGYTTLVSAVGTADLTSVFTGADKFTVFAPANSAFTGLTLPTDKAALGNILKYHVVAGDIKAADVITLSNGNLVKVTSASGDSLWVKASSANGVFVNGIQVIRPNMSATNGVAHGLGKVLLPPSGDIVETAIAAKFDSLAKAILRANGAGGDPTLLNTLKTARLTVFAPTNAAFTALLQTLNLKDINEIPIATLVAVLKHHVTGGRVFSNDISNNLQVDMVNGSKSTILVDASGASIKGSNTVLAGPTAKITATDIVAKNGVIHVIDKVIIP
jgi:uncharacterized surface protein with fasciclin (FAS1) repeats